MNKEVKILFYYDTVDEDSFMPKCIIFFIYENILYHSEIKMNATSLKDSGHYVISTYLDESYDELINDIIIDDKKLTEVKDIEKISESNSEFIVIKNKLKGILRKQKIQLLLN